MNVMNFNNYSKKVIIVMKNIKIYNVRYYIQKNRKNRIKKYWKILQMTKIQNNK